MNRLGRGIWLSLLVCGLLLLASGGAAAQNDDSLTVESAPVPDVHFGASLVFYINAHSSDPVTSAVLVYQTVENQARTVHALAFEPSEQVSLSHVVELARYPLNPFAEIRYWWTVSDAAGRTVTTDPQTFVYMDSRFEEGQSLAGQHVVVHWYEGDDAFGVRALSAAEQAVIEIRDRVAPALTLSEPYHLYLYASEQDLAPALPASGREWAVGQAYPRLRIAVLAVPANLGSVSTMNWLIPHELTHLVLYEAAQPDYDNLPEWLNEGLAVVSEQSLNPDDALLLEQAVQNNQLLPLKTLCYSFPRQEGRLGLAYAQSASVVTFIEQNYGHSAIVELVAAYGEGLTCRRGVSQVLGVDLEELESDWLASLGPRTNGTASLRQAAPWLLLILLSLPALVIVVLPLTGRGKA